MRKRIKVTKEVMAELQRKWGSVCGERQMRNVLRYEADSINAKAIRRNAIELGGEEVWDEVPVVADESITGGLVQVLTNGVRCELTWSTGTERIYVGERLVATHEDITHQEWGDILHHYAALTTDELDALTAEH